MKRILSVITVIFCLAVPNIPAQRTLPGQRSLQVMAGTVNGVNLNDGFHTGIAFSEYVKNAGKWVFGTVYLEKDYSYKSIKIPQSQFTIEGGYFLKMLSDPHRTFFVSVGASAIGGYETVNWGRKLLFDGATIVSKDNFLYGGTLTLEAEVFLAGRLILFAGVSERLLEGSSVGKFYTLPEVGIKWMIN